MDQCKIVAQLNSIKTTKDGGGRLVLEFGNESLEEIQKLQRLAGDGEQNFIAVFVPFQEDEKKPDDFRIDF